MESLACDADVITLTYMASIESICSKDTALTDMHMLPCNWHAENLTMQAIGVSVYKCVRTRSAYIL